MKNKQENWETRFDKIAYFLKGRPGYKVIKDFIAQEKTPKGVCKNCWNRGYSTQMIGGTIVYGDFIGDKDYKTKAEILIKFCNCENGKQLKSMIEEKIKESKQKWEGEKCMAINKEVAKESYEEFIKPIIAKEKHQYRQEILGEQKTKIMKVKQDKRFTYYHCCGQIIGIAKRMPKTVHIGSILCGKCGRRIY